MGKYRKEYIEVLYMGVVEDQTDPNNIKDVHFGFFVQKIKGDGHLYDSAIKLLGEPKKEYKKLDYIPLEDLEIKFVESGHLCEIKFK